VQFPPATRRIGATAVAARAGCAGNHHPRQLARVTFTANYSPEASAPSASLRAHLSVPAAEVGTPGPPGGC